MEAIDIFRKAVWEKIREKPRGIQTRIAEYMGIELRTLNYFLHGSKGFPDHRREKIAEFFGTTYIDLLNLGQKLIAKEQKEPEPEKGQCIPFVKSSEYLDRLKIMIQEYTGNTDYKMYAKAVNIPWNRFKKYAKGEFPTAEDLLRICILSERSPFWLIWGIKKKYIDKSKKVFEIFDQKISLSEILEMTEDIFMSEDEQAHHILLNCILTYWQVLKKIPSFQEQPKKKAVRK